jgi:hypothetical protein
VQLVAFTNLNCATGDADGLGEVRKKELIKSGLQLGVGSKEDILVVEDKYGALHGIPTNSC